MVGRRSPMRSRTGASRRVPAAEMGRTTAAVVETRLNVLEQKVHVAARSAAKLARHSMQEALTAAEVVRSSMQEAVVAVARATRNIVKEAFAAWRAVMPAAPMMKRSVGKAGPA